MPGEATTCPRNLYLWALLGLVELAACGLDSGLHPEPGGANGGDGLDVDGSVVVSAGGVGAWDASNALLGGGNDAGSAGISGSGGIGSGGAGSGTASGGLGGATPAGGAAGTDGSELSGAGGLGPAGAADDEAGTSPPPPLPHALLFSEYVEGSSTNKALELVALERSSLSGCSIQTFFNGSAEAGASVSLAGELAAGEAWTVCTSKLAGALGAACKQTANLTFNGDDAVLLECDGVPLDVIGQIGVDPGAGWGSGDTLTVDHTLRRACSVAHGHPTSQDVFDPSLEWLGYPSDSFGDLAARDCTGGTPGDAGTSPDAAVTDAAADSD